MRLILGVLSLVVTTALPYTALAQSPTELRWLEFQRDPKVFMQKTPPKTDSNGSPIAVPSIFSRYDMESQDFVTKKNSIRLGDGVTKLANPICNEQGICLEDIVAGRAGAISRVEDFLDASEFADKGIKPLNTLLQMERAKLRKAQLAETPWSDTYWPISQGILGVRYASMTFGLAGHDWKARYDLLDSPDESLRQVVTGRDPVKVDGLSPSEKYDLLIGDLTHDGQVYNRGYLTPSMWAEGERYFQTAGKVEEWMGICHGWAPASFMIKRPKQAIEVASADGKTKLKFYPSDLKGLSSYLWAKSNTASAYLGGRCNDKKPKQDPLTGRNLSEECFDTNPANWHMAIVNQIGVAKRSFVMDATFDYEVWNQPVYAYSYKYFNPQTGKTGNDLDRATVEAAKFTKDRFKQFRSPKAKSFVGIEMEVTYVIEVEPNHENTDSAAADQTTTVSYMYDLELDGNGVIVGGEWYSNAHPDFLWMPPAQARAVSYGDSQVGSLTGAWKPGQPLPKFWQDIAVVTATRYGQPLAAIVEALVEESNK